MKKTVLLAILIIALALTGCDRLPGAAAAAAPTATTSAPVVSGSDTVIVEGTIVPVEDARLVTRAGGKVLDVLVEEGSVVAAGDVIARLDGAVEIEAQRAAAELERLNAQQAMDELDRTAGQASAQDQTERNEATLALIEAQQALDDLDEDQYDTDLDNAKSDVQTAQDELDDAQEAFDKYADLDEENSNRKNAETRLEDAQKKYDDAVRKRDRLIQQMDSAKAAVTAAQARLDEANRAIEDGRPDPDDLALVQSRLAAAEAQIAAAEKALADLEITAPFGGTVVELDAAVGETLLPNSPVALLADLTTFYVETTDLTEMDVVSVSEGQAAIVTPDALPELNLPGVVETVAQSSGKKGGDVTYTVRLTLDETDPRLRWGMTVEVRFED